MLLLIGGDSIVCASLIRLAPYLEVSYRDVAIFLISFFSLSVDDEQGLLV